MFMILSALAAMSGSPQATTDKAVESDPVLCTRSRAVSVVGTHVRPKKVCMRKSDQEFEEKNAQRELQQINTRGNLPGPALGRAGEPE
jgi:hypothetical protein